MERFKTENRTAEATVERFQRGERGDCRSAVHLKEELQLDRCCLVDANGAIDEWLFSAIVQNLRKLAKCRTTNPFVAQKSNTGKVQSAFHPILNSRFSTHLLAVTIPSMVTTYGALTKLRALVHLTTDTDG